MRKKLHTTKYSKLPRFFFSPENKNLPKNLNSLNLCYMIEPV